jgi:hypothetical protein
VDKYIHNWGNMYYNLQKHLSKLAHMSPEEFVEFDAAKSCGSGFSGLGYNIPLKKFVFLQTFLRNEP